MNFSRLYGRSALQILPQDIFAKMELGDKLNEIERRYVQRLLDAHLEYMCESHPDNWSVSPDDQ